MKEYCLTDLVLIFPFKTDLSNLESLTLGNFILHNACCYHSFIVFANDARQYEKLVRLTLVMLLFYILHSFLFIKMQHSIYNHVFSSIVKIRVDPDQVAF